MGFADTTGGNSDRAVSPGAGRTVTFNGNINFGNDRLFPENTAGTIVLNGNNSGDGTGSAISAGTNSFRSTMRNNIAGTQLQLGSNPALGNAAAGTFAGGDLVLKGVVANQNMSVRAGSVIDASGSSIVVNTAAVSVNGTNDFTIGSLVNQGGNRDFNVNGSNQLTVANGIFYSEGQTARQLNVNLAGGGGMVVNGPLHATLHSGGIATTKTAGAGGTQQVTATARFQGAQTVTLNGDSSATFAGGEVRANGAGTTIRLGHASAMGNATSFVDIDNGSTLDLNGFVIAQSVLGLDGAGAGGNGALVNTDTITAAGVSSDITNVGNFSVGGAGDVELQRVSHTAVVARSLTKVGAGTLTLSGSSDNTRYGLIVNGGTANLNKRGTGRAVINNPLVINGAGAVARLTGSGTDQVGDAEAVQVINGTLDLNGRAETAATLTVGDGVTDGSITGGAGSVYTVNTADTIEARSGSAAAALAGAGVPLNKTTAGTFMLSGVNTYTGDTTVTDGTLSLADDAVLLFDIGASGVNNKVAGAGTVNLAGDFTFDLSAAGTSVGDAWNIVDVANLAETFTASFTVTGFSESADVWTMPITATEAYEFRESTGTLSVVVVPEPASLGILGIATLGLTTRRRSLRQASLA